MKEAKWMMILAVFGLVACVTPSLGAQGYSATPTSVQLNKDVSYGTAEGETLLCDIYVPKDGLTQHAGLVVIHGGGWVEGSKGQLGTVYYDLARNGFVVMDINYRLNKPYPVAVDDCQRAVRWLRANAAQYKVDPTRLGSTGQSAGGHLASILGVCNTLHPAGDSLDGYSSKVQAVVNQFGPTQVIVTPTAWGIPYTYNSCGNCTEGLINEEASPLYHVDSTSAPFLMVNGGQDTTVNPENQFGMAKALWRANVEASVMIWPNTGHGNGTYDPVVWHAAKDFFKRQLAKK